MAIMDVRSEHPSGFMNTVVNCNDIQGNLIIETDIFMKNKKKH